jgi:RNA polymerase sigma-70 factor (ECF subfamily)
MSGAKADASVDLLRHAQAGDAAALNELLERYLPRLQRWARGRLPWGLRTMLETADLVQDAMINALPHVQVLEVRNERALESYLRQAVRNRIIDLHKRKRRRPAREEMPMDVAAPGVLPDDEAMHAEAIERYRRALASLSKGEREAVELRLERGLTYEAIASRLGKRSPDAARMFVTRAIVRLADKMGRQRT